MVTIIKLKDCQVFEGRLKYIRNGEVKLITAEGDKFFPFADVETITNPPVHCDLVLGDITISQTAGGDIVRGDKIVS